MTSFGQKAERQFEGELHFSSVVELLSLVVTKSQKSLHAAYQSHHEELSVSLTGFYDKLVGMELPVIRALVRDTAQRMRAVAQQLEPDRQSLLAGYELRVLDGSHLAAGEHRIKETFRLRGGPLPGHSLVILDPTRGFVVDKQSTLRPSKSGQPADWRPSICCSRCDLLRDRYILLAVRPIRPVPEWRRSPVT